MKLLEATQNAGKYRRVVVQGLFGLGLLVNIRCAPSLSCLPLIDEAFLGTDNGAVGLLANGPWFKATRRNLRPDPPFAAATSPEECRTVWEQFAPLVAEPKVDFSKNIILAFVSYGPAKRKFVGFKLTKRRQLIAYFEAISPPNNQNLSMAIWSQFWVVSVARSMLPPAFLLRDTDDEADPLLVAN